MGRPCSGEEDHRWRGPRGGRASGAHGGLIAPRVEGRGGREGGSRREPEVVAEGSTMTVMLRRPTPARNLRASINESWGSYWCRQLGT
jgi:hypothetical protein